MLYLMKKCNISSRFIAAFQAAYRMGILTQGDALGYCNLSLSGFFNAFIPPSHRNGSSQAILCVSPAPRLYVKIPANTFSHA